MRSLNSQTDAVRYYDGNGREIKRVTANYQETPYAGWTMKPDKYYIRSSVLNNEVVSEVRATGKKENIRQGSMYPNCLPISTRIRHSTIKRICLF